MAAPFKSSKGFSLIELLIAISIVALVGTVAIPNLNKFSRSQELQTTASQVVDTLKGAQSSAQSRIRCPRGEPSDTWIVTLSSDDYSLTAKCLATGDELLYTKNYTPSGASGLTIKGTLNVCSSSPSEPNSTVFIVFQKNQVTYRCLGDTTYRTGVVYLTLTDLSDPANTKKIRIGIGGVLRIE